MRRTVTIATGLLFAGLALGCMNLSIGGRTEVVAPDGTFTQTGTAVVRAGEDLAVYYPVPFLSPPNLVIEDTSHVSQITEQRPECFHVKNLSPFVANVTWTARGMRLVPPGPPVAGVAAPPPGN